MGFSRLFFTRRQTAKKPETHQNLILQTPNKKKTDFLAKKAAAVASQRLAHGLSLQLSPLAERLGGHAKHAQKHTKKRLLRKSSCDFHIFLVASDLIHRRFHDKRAVRKRRKCQNIADGILAERSKA